MHLGRWTHWSVLFLAVSLAAGCRRPPASREFVLEGQVLAVRTADLEVVIKHGDVKGLMPGMTMPFKVRDAGVIGRVQPGDIVTATLVVREADSFLTRITPTGRRAPVPADAALPRVMDPPLTPGDAVPAVALLDQDGRPFSPADLRGHAWALTFIYTRCPLPGFCPTLERRFVEAQRLIRDDRALAGARLVAISIDPEYDRPPVLAAHAARLAADTSIWRFVTGERQAIDRFGERFGLTVVRGSGTPEEMVHSMRTATVSPDGRVTRILEGSSWDAAALVAALREAGRK